MFIVVTIVVTLIVITAIGYWLFMSSYSQLFGRYYWRFKTDDKLVAITFDDGPNEPYTSQILSILDEHDAKATFFQVGRCIERYPKTTKKIIDAGHTIGNHSLSHEFRRYFKSLSFKHEIMADQEIIRLHTGKTPALYRSPWLWRQPFLLRTVKLEGLTAISGVFCHPLEVLGIDAQKIAQKSLSQVRPGSIIIFHDGKDGVGGDRSQTVKAAAIVIDKLVSQGYRLVTVDQLLGIPAYQD